MVASPVRPAPAYNGSPTSSSSASGAATKNMSAREAGNGNGSSSPSGSTGSGSSCGVRRLSSSEGERGKVPSVAGSRMTSSPAVSGHNNNNFQPKFLGPSESSQPSVSKEPSQRNPTVLPSTPVGFSQQQFSEMEYLTSRYLRQQQQQQQIQAMFQQHQQQQQEPFRPVSRSGGCFDGQLNVLRQEMVTFGGKN